MPKLTINLTVEQRTTLESNGIDVAQFLKDALRAKFDNMIWVSQKNLDNIPGRVKNKTEVTPEVPDAHAEKLKDSKTQGKLDFIDFVKGKFKQNAKDIVKVALTADSVSVTITPKQEAFLFCDMASPQAWISNAIRAKANKLIEASE